MEQAIGGGAWVSPPVPGTVVLPLTPAMARALERRLAIRMRGQHVVFGGMGAICILGAVFITIIYPPIFPLALLMVACGAFSIWCGATFNRPMVCSMSSGVFCRTEGRLKVEGGDLPIIRVGEVRMQCLPYASRLIKRVPYGVIDYLQGGVVIIEIRDAWGKVHYRMPGYVP